MSTNPSQPRSESIDEEKPGTSASFFQGSQVQVGESGNKGSPSEENSSDGSSTSSLLKARNAIRGHPTAETPESKRQRIVQEHEHDLEDDDEGIRMDTESSGEDHSSDQENRVEPIEIDSEQDLDSVPVQEQTNSETLVKNTSSRRSSTADEGVSTTIPLSSPTRSHYDPQSTRFGVGEAIASTSATAMAPPLSRIMEDSAILDDLYRLPIFEPDEDVHSKSHQDIRRRPSREVTPAPGTSGDIENLYFRKNMATDVNENRGPEAFLQKMHGKQRLMWARKLFFLSTELVFPGFKACSDNKTQMPDYMGVRVRSSVMMQALLYADALFFVMWVLSFISTCDILITVLKQLHGYLSVCLTCLFILVNILRLRFGLKGNENDEVQYLALFWMTTVIVQIPLFTFIFLTDLFCPVLMAFTVTMDGMMMVFILVESIVGFIHFRSLLRDELNIIRMARRSKEANRSQANISSVQRNENQAANLGISKLNPPRNDYDEEGDSTSDTESESNNRYGSRQERMDFRMHIRRLSETQRSEQQQPDAENDDSDSSEQVTSTSDNVRQRSIRAH